MIPLRRFLQLAGSAALAAAPQSARAQSYPSRPITIMVFVGAGGAPDIIARLIGQGLSQRIGQPVVIENRPGGGGNLSLQAVARAPADGHTLLLIATPHAINVTLYEKLNVNVIRDIAPVASINNDSFVMLVNPSSPVKSVAEFIVHAKSNPGKVNLTSSGNGNLTHLSGELFRMASGIDLVHVPYRNTPAALTALMAGDVHVIFDALPSAMPHVKAGSLRPLGVTAPARVKALPDVPSISDTVPGYAVTGWLGIGAPHGTPAEIIAKLNKDINAVVSDPEIAARLASFGSDPFTSTPASFGKLIAAETEKWEKVVRFAGLKIE
ncbi:MAG: tripartite tricarboxylate transporter substrate binding protein [Xanthobacteraceae bacterium]